MESTFVFNGDADGLCALQQLWLAEAPRAARRVTGPKRRIDLVQEVEAGAGTLVTVLDISFEVNRKAVLSLLAGGARVRYFDHHRAGEVPRHPRLEAYLDPAPEVCTSLLVDRYLGARHSAWALVGAFGDNLEEAAWAMAAARGVPRTEAAALRELGIALNYNAYGETLADLHFAPAELAERLCRHASPASFIREDPAFARLRQGYADDLARAASLRAFADAGHAAVYVLPDASWSRRVGGVLASQLARAAPARAHAVVLPRTAGGWQVSVRAPLERPRRAAALCAAWPSGGGREGAAGINHLPAGELERFAARFIAHFQP